MEQDKFTEKLYEVTRDFYRDVPSTLEARRFTDSLVNLLFPLRDNNYIPLKDLDFRWKQLQIEFERIITPICRKVKDCCCISLTDEFFNAIPGIFESLMEDAEMYEDCDPASYCKEEIILCYPGFYAVMIHRIANVMYRLRIPILPRVISEYAHSQTGIDINPGATIGKRFYIDHGTGIVVGETTIIGNNVKVYQGVTLGAAFVEKELQGERRHPVIEDNVIIYAGSTILGGDTVIGHDSIVGGNVWLTESIPPYSKVYHKPEIVIKENGNGKKK